MLIWMTYHLVNRTIHEIQQDWGLFKIEKQTIIILKYTKISTELLNEPSNFNIFFFTLSLFAELSSISDVLSNNLELNSSAKKWHAIRLMESLFIKLKSELSTMF